jgi:hypothetical protein
VVNVNSLLLLNYNLATISNNQALVTVRDLLAIDVIGWGKGLFGVYKLNAVDFLNLEAVGLQRWIDGNGV